MAPPRRDACEGADEKRCHGRHAKIWLPQGKREEGVYDHRKEKAESGDPQILYSEKGIGAC